MAVQLCSCRGSSACSCGIWHVSAGGSSVQSEIEPNCPNPTLLLDQSPVHSAAGACKVRPASCGEWPEHAQVKLRAVVVLLQLFGQNDKAFVGRPFGRESPRPAAPQTATKLVTTIAGALRGKAACCQPPPSHCPAAVDCSHRHGTRRRNCCGPCPRFPCLGPNLSSTGHGGALMLPSR